MILGALGGAMWFAADYTKTKQQNRDLRRAQTVGHEIVRILGDGVQAIREREAAYQEMQRELSNVQDDNTCHSPAIDHALELLRGRWNEN